MRRRKNMGHTDGVRRVALLVGLIMVATACRQASEVEVDSASGATETPAVSDGATAGGSAAGEIGSDAGSTNGAEASVEPQATVTTTPTVEPEAGAAATPSVEPAPGGAGSFGACSIGDTRVEGDFDGDGALDRAAYQGVADDDRKVVVCLAGGGVSTLPATLESRYLAVLDVEDDGRSELLFGESYLSDRPDGPEIAYRLAVVTDGELAEVEAPRLHVRRVHYPGYSLEYSGFGCVDADADGARDLVVVVGEIEGDELVEGDVVGWQRVAFAIDGLTTSVVADETGGLVVGVDDEAISLLSQGSCGEELVANVRFPPPVASCDDGPNRTAVGADVDGDGQDDAVYQRFTDFGPVVGVCTAAGVHDERTVGGMGEIFYARDLDGDGRAEVLSGGTTVSAGFVEVHRLDGDRLTPIFGLGLEEGFTQFYPDDPAYQVVPTWSGWGCADVAGDERREVVQVVVRPDGDQLIWQRTSYALEGLAAREVLDENGVLDAPPSQIVDNFLLELSDDALAEAAGLVTPC